MAATPERVLRRLTNDSDFVKRRLDAIETWIASGEIEPWKGVVLAEWLRRAGTNIHHEPTPQEFEALFADDAMIEIMREQVDGPWMVYVDQVRGIHANDRVMTFLSDLDDLSNAS